MKKKLLKLLAKKKEIYFLDLPELMPEIKGEFSIYMSVKPGINPNILWLAGVTNKFIKVFNEVLIEEKSVVWEPINPMFVIFDGKPMYSMPIAKASLAKSQKECWLPIILKLSK
jgi:hypothetical protein